MNREELEKLTIQEQIDFINKKLKNGLSLTRICEDLGIARSTIGKRFKKNNYIFDKQEGIYKSITEVHYEEAHESNTFVNHTESNDLYIVGEEEKKLLKAKKELFELLEIKEDLKDIVKEYRLNKNVIDIPELKINKDNFKGEIVPKTFKVYESVLNDFMEISKKENYKMQDIINQALYEFAEKYKR